MKLHCTKLETLLYSNGQTAKIVLISRRLACRVDLASCCPGSEVGLCLKGSQLNFQVLAYYAPHYHHHHYSSSSYYYYYYYEYDCW